MLVFFCCELKLVLLLCISVPIFWQANTRNMKRPVKENLTRLSWSVFSAHLNAVRILLVILCLSVLSISAAALGVGIEEAFQCPHVAGNG